MNNYGHISEQDFRRFVFEGAVLPEGCVIEHFTRAGATEIYLRGPERQTRTGAHRPGIASCRIDADGRMSGFSKPTLTSACDAQLVL